MKLYIQLTIFRFQNSKMCYNGDWGPLTSKKAPQAFPISRWESPERNGHFVSF